MTLLSFNSKYVVQSTVQVQTASAVLVDDTEASQTFALTATQTILAIYQANNDDGATMDAGGMTNAISIDGVDFANSNDSPDTSNDACRNCTFWIGSLATGNHTIKGRVSNADGAGTVSINNRILLIYILNGDEFQYVDDATSQTSSSSTLANDPNASVTFTPSGNCVALYLYNVTNVDAATEDSSGKKIAINVAGSNFSQAEIAPNASNDADSVITYYANTLTAVATTVVGRFARNSVIGTVTVNRRQLGVLLFANDTLLDSITSNVQVTTASGTLVNDTEATISRVTSDTRELLVVAMGTKRFVSTSAASGEAYGIQTNSVDRQLSRSSSGLGGASPTSEAITFAQNLTAGSHTIQGRFSKNAAADITNAIIDSRRIFALWLTAPAIGPNLYQFSTRRSKIVGHTFHQQRI